jgi:hypothetical protein
MKIEFYSQYGAARESASYLGETLTTIADGQTAGDVWTDHAVVGAAPAGTAEARLVLEFVQPSGQPGAVYVDDVSLRVVTAGDYNGDGVVDSGDLAVWTAEFGGGAASSADGDRDGDVDGADYLVWQQNFGASLEAAEAAATLVPEPDADIILAAVIVTYPWLTAIVGSARRNLIL